MNIGSKKPRKREHLETRFSFQIKLGERTIHRVLVQVHSTRTAMRSCIRLRCHGDTSNTEATCFQAYKPQMDGIISEIHLHRQVAMDVIVHESTNAAIHRTRCAGIPHTDEVWEEWICDSTELITNLIVKELKKHGINPKWKRLLNF